MKEKKEITVAKIAGMTGGQVAGGGSRTIRGVASLEHADADAISFLGGVKHREAALASKAGALIVSEALATETPQVIVADPYQAFVKVMEYFHPAERPKPGVHPTAVIGEGATLGDEVHVGPVAVIGESARIGGRSVIGAGCVIGPDCVVGEDSFIHAGVTIYPGCRVGDRVIIHSGTVIGADGFGFILSEHGHVKKPQVGTVIIENDVEIGANCALDRAMLDATVVGAGSKLDNLVHLAHGVRVGRHCIILVGAAVGGSTVIGDNCVISGAVTIKDNVKLGKGCMVAGHSAVTDDVGEGEVVWGFPAVPFSLAKRIFARLKQLPDLFKRVRALEKARDRDEEQNRGSRPPA